MATTTRIDLTVTLAALLAAPCPDGSDRSSQPPRGSRPELFVRTRGYLMKNDNATRIAMKPPARRPMRFRSFLTSL